MRKTYQLNTCNTCQRILGEYGERPNLEVINIGDHPITEAELDHMKDLAGSYEALFSRRAMKYRSMGLADKVLAEEDYRRLILEEYTFLKRPVTIVGKNIFVGNSKKVVAATIEALNGL
ncbi:arsenate reductase family protein [Neolewinella antarctica]|uniref:Arsenate reductase n=1 Tax=Neolewinella antarctica TaxID=442734 RepID=A0ABX0XCB0_9BACT|nr:ArsC/Spx/MgsR family protein [Neolewinella antarctica]NJC26720.1 arsenate reductase [Neolewinella antarctica]